MNENSAPAVKNSRLAAALHLAGLGFPVFPLYSPSEGDPKRPRIKGWQEQATTDTNKLCACWAQWPDCNPGILTTDYVALDVDAKPDRDGYAALRALGYDPLQLAGETYSQHTPSGGLHIVYRAPYPVRGGVDVLGPGVDIRGRGGLVVGAGAEFPGGAYTANDLPVANAPAWLLDRLQRAREKSGQPVEILKGVDAQRAERRAVEYLESLPVATEGGRNVACHDAANRLGDLGVDPDAAVSLMVEHFRTAPGLDHDEIEKTTRSAYNSREAAIGYLAPEILFSRIPGAAAANEDAPAPSSGDETRERRPRFKIRSGADLLIDYPNRRDLVEDLLPEQGVSLIVGAPGCGKSFLALDMGLHVALGRTWHGYNVKAGSCVYIAAEASDAQRIRFDAWCRHYNVKPEKIPFGLVSAAPNLRSAEDTAALVDAIRDFSAVPVLIFIDTVAQVLNGDENSAADVNLFLANCNGIARAFGCHVVAVHHLGKDARLGARGSSAFVGNVDNHLNVETTPRGTNVYLGRNKLGATGPALSFRLEPVPLGTNYYGKSVQGAVVKPTRPAGSDVFDPVGPQPKGDKARIALAKLRELAAVTEDPRGWVRAEDWRRACVGALSPEASLTTDARAFRRARKDLTAEKFVIDRGDHVMPEIFPPENSE